MAAGAFGLWGLLPIYWKALAAAGAGEILAHRIVWSALCCALLLAYRRGVRSLLASLATPRIFLSALGSSVLIAVNWLTYIWAVNAGLVLEASLGYFINPLVCVLLGFLFLGERLRRMQAAAVCLAAAGVAFLTFHYGAVPWVALTLAFSFGLYGLCRKTARLNSLEGLTAETLLLLLPAAWYLGGLEAAGEGSFFSGEPVLTLLLFGAGPVTAVPLLLFAAGARMLPLATVGLLQYIAPTLQFALAVFLYGEPFTPAHLITFSLIWVALALYSFEGWHHGRHLQRCLEPGIKRKQASAKLADGSLSKGFEAEGPAAAGRQL